MEIHPKKKTFEEHLGNHVKRIAGVCPDIHLFLD